MVASAGILAAPVTGIIDDGPESVASRYYIHLRPMVADVVKQSAVINDFAIEMEEDSPRVLFICVLVSSIIAAQYTRSASISLLFVIRISTSNSPSGPSHQWQLLDRNLEGVQLESCGDCILHS